MKKKRKNLETKYEIYTSCSTDKVEKFVYQNGEDVIKADRNRFLDIQFFW